MRERVNCLRGSKSKLTGFVVRLEILPRPLGCLSQGPKVTQFDCMRVPQGEIDARHPQIDWDSYLQINKGINSCFQLKSEREYRPSNLLDSIQDTAEGWRKELLGGWRQKEW